MPSYHFKTLVLTPEQELNAKGIDWLIRSTGRGQGKTLLMSKAFIEKAIDNIDEWVELYDHNGTKYTDMRHMIGMIHGIFSDIEFFPKGRHTKYNLEYNERNRAIRVVIRSVEDE